MTLEEAALMCIKQSDINEFAYLLAMYQDAHQAMYGCTALALRHSKT
jgi:hypothetical protein